jgi:hypothetical protein
VQLEFSSNHETGYINWLLSKGDDLPISTPKKAVIDVNDSFAEGKPRIAYLKLVAWDGDNQPLRVTEGPYEVCELRVDLTDVPLEKFVKKTVPAGDIYVADCKVEITIEGSKLEFRLLFGDVACGLVTGEYK